MTSHEHTPSSGENWEEQARNWITWVRRPGHDSYWHYRSDFFALLPAAGKATLDLGCGEGRVSRDLARLGHKVTGVDASPTLLEAAREAHPEGDYLLGDAAGLPFPDESFDLVVAYMSLMDMDDMFGAVREARRVLVPGGRLVFSVVHPSNTGRRTGEGSDRAFVVDGTYFASQRVNDEVERDGLHMVFKGYRHSLGTYSRALEEAGFLVEALREPVSGTAPGSMSVPLPWHLWIRALRSTT